MKSSKLSFLKLDNLALTLFVLVDVMCSSKLNRLSTQLNNSWIVELILDCKSSTQLWVELSLNWLLYSTWPRILSSLQKID